MSATSRTICCAVAVFALLWALGCRGKSNRSSSAQQDDPAGTPADIGPEPGASRVNASVRRDDERVVLGDLVIESTRVDGEEQVELYTRDLGRRLGRLLVGSPLFEARASHVAEGYRPREASLEMDIEYGVTPDAGDSAKDPGQALIEAHMVARVVWADGGDDLAPVADIRVERTLSAAERVDEDGLIALTVAEGVTHVGHALLAQEQVRVGDQEAVLSGLRSTDVELVLWALAIVAERGHAVYYDAVVMALHAEEIEVRDRALEALVAIGDRRAVDILGKRAAFDDHLFMAKVVDAVVTLGGPDAITYLEFIASGHPDDELRAQAADGVARLRGAAPAP